MMIASIVLCAGCFWSVELLFQRVPGVVKTSVGYAGVGTTSQRRSPPPSYRDVLKGDTGLCEAVKIDYDENVLSTDLLLDIFFEMHDPYDAECQGYVCLFLFFIRMPPQNTYTETIADRSIEARCSLKTRNNGNSFDRKFSQV